MTLLMGLHHYIRSDGYNLLPGMYPGRSVQCNNLAACFSDTPTNTKGPSANNIPAPPATTVRLHLLRPQSSQASLGYAPSDRVHIAVLFHDALFHVAVVEKKAEDWNWAKVAFAPSLSEALSVG